MRELRIGEQTVRVRATPLALLFYRQEFNSDLLGDLIGLVQSMTADVEKGSDIQSFDLTKFDSVAILRLIWAMAKADAYGREKFPSFMDWLATLDSFDLADAEVMTAAIEEATNGFFRSGAVRGDAAGKRT